MDQVIDKLQSTYLKFPKEVEEDAKNFNFPKLIEYNFKFWDKIKGKRIKENFAYLALLISFIIRLKSSSE